MGVWSNRCCLKIQRPLQNSVTHILMGHRSLQPTGLAAGCFYVHASDTWGPPRRHRRGQFCKLQSTLREEFYRDILQNTHWHLHPSWQRHIGNSPLPHTNTNTVWSLVEWQISPPRSNLTRNSNEIKCHQWDFSPFLLIVLGNGIRARWPRPWCSKTSSPSCEHQVDVRYLILGSQFRQ